MTFSIGGLASGLDTNAIIQQLLTLEARPLDRLDQKRADLVAKQGQFSEFQSKLQTLADKITSLKDSSELTLFTSTSTDEDVATIEASDGALPSSYSIQVNQLATAKSVAFTSPFNDSDQSTFGDGTIDLTIGTTTQQITVDAGDTLVDIRDKINAADAGAQASVIYDGSSYQLVVNSEETGVANQFTLTASGFNDPGETDPFATSTVLEAGQDSQFTINGLAVTASSNSVDGAVDGLTFNLKKVGSADVTIDRDTEGIGDRLQEALDAYNDVVSFIDSQGDDQDVALRGIKNQLATATASNLDGGTFSLIALSQIGISTDSSGKLNLDRGDLESAIENDFNAVRDLFTGKNGTDGLGAIFDTILNGDGTNAGILSPGNGTLRLRQTSLDARIRSLDDQIANAEQRLRRTEETLRRKFASFEGLTAQYQSQGAFLSASLGRLG